MGYYIRVLSTGTAAVPVAELERALAAAGVSATLEAEELDARDILASADVEDAWIDDEPAPASLTVVEPVDQAHVSGWRFLLVRTADGTPVAEIERNPVVPRSLGADELAELTTEASEAEPASAARWLEAWLPRVRTIYAIRILSGSEAPGGWDLIRAVQAALWRSAEGVLQADYEGFTNTAGDHILWRFDHDIEGERRVAVLAEDGVTWRSFTMDLADPAQRAAFLEGRAPEPQALGATP